MQLALDKTHYLTAAGLWGAALFACTQETTAPEDAGSPTNLTAASSSVTGGGANVTAGGVSVTNAGSGATTAGDAATSAGVGGTGSTDACATAELRCEDACVAVMSDPRHCGTCGNVCASGEVCEGGACRVSGSGGATTASVASATTAGATAGDVTSSTGASGATGVQINGTCYPLCADADSDPDADDWGWENEASCVVEGSDTAAAGSACTPASSASLTSSSTVTSTSGGTATSTSGGTGYDCANPGGGSCPSNVSCPSGMPCGCQIVDGLGASKCALLNVGASLYMLASAMMETDSMNAADYPYGDNKTGDSFNAGVCKQNWGMMRQCHPDWQSLGQDQYAASAAMNSDRALDVQVYDECRAYFGDLWWAGHRNGAQGLTEPNTQDIQNFKTAMDWTYATLPGHESDDVRFWVSVPAIDRVSGVPLAPVE